MPGPRALTADAVIEFDEGVILMKRTHPPFEGSWVLPGGLVEQDETAREACVRETKEEVGLSIFIEEFIGLYDDPDRDERGNVTAAYRCRSTTGETPVPREEAAEVKTFSLENLPQMGFDHKQIVIDALDG
jgi:8-oxo-dGTP diphosphatase